ncbi:ribonuclease P protein subunit [Ignisphaera sp. 4213-co]|uniref:Ribonuclease P protein component 1 n=1 Tax=Ignisphaera cupida TaxID=3050454 RepID=A0ABD4Z3Q9_9CREN|nr:ribonuclease P protein subunit [Ignisphaera sp. 4213-co]MDK6027951.1 ribonuclease P protein subunit [Ignisphaera sp. 4213-co]
MLRTGSNLVYHELIGLYVEVVSHLDPTLKGLSGIVVDETMNTLRIADYNRKKIVTVMKKGGLFIFTIPETGEKVFVDGNKIFGRPEDRLKKFERQK